MCCQKNLQLAVKTEKIAIRYSCKIKINTTILKSAKQIIKINTALIESANKCCNSKKTNNNIGILTN